MTPIIWVFTSRRTQERDPLSLLQTCLPPVALSVSSMPMAVMLIMEPTVEWRSVISSRCYSWWYLWQWTRRWWCSSRVLVLAVTYAITLTELVAVACAGNPSRLPRLAVGAFSGIDISAPAFVKVCWVIAFRHRVNCRITAPLRVLCSSFCLLC